VGDAPVPTGLVGASSDQRHWLSRDWAMELATLEFVWAAEKDDAEPDAIVRDYTFNRER
jgi:hypothetical protein